jgi:CRISPR-associated protein Cas6
MFWQEETPPHQFQVPDDVMDLVFDIECRELPVDHAHALATALRCALPWLGEAPDVGVHTIHVAGSQNGWERPAHSTANRLVLSQRTKLILRAHQGQQAALRQGLAGISLEIDGCRMKIGKAKVRPLCKQTTLIARYVVVACREDENDFLRWAAAELHAMGIRMRKALCGKTLTLVTPGGPLPTRSLMLADLSLEESVRIQQRGLGSHRFMGCGIFLPHKGIGAVKDMAED